MTARALRVLTTKGSDDVSANPYVSILARHNAELMDVREFSWRQAFFGDHDVVHLHWPEAIVRSRSGLKQFGKTALLRLLVAVDRLRGRAHVSTIHNIETHEQGSAFERATLRAWLGSCQTRIYLTRAGLQGAGDDRGVVIPHGDYAEFVTRYRPDAAREQSEASVGRVLLFGMLRRYKGVERLIEEFGRIDPALGLELVIAGKAIDADYERQLGELAAATPAVTVHADRFLSHSELIETVMHSELVILPYERMYNSGAALMALTLQRPVAATGSPSLLELADEFGAGWVQALPAELTAEAIVAAVTALRTHDRGAAPDWTAREWPAIAAAHRDAYRTAVADARAGRRSSQHPPSPRP
ncbi:glycosyltransferase [Gryllotalpicola koreensis]|uniref:GDP-mannose--glycolipid 4-beta-D-mannosyltransferase n=1 Tax=Gryllotalpicola koreensis TaxID=993086 RepID=A0ABP8A0E1_9MICO